MKNLVLRSKNQENDTRIRVKCEFSLSLPLSARKTLRANAPKNLQNC